MMKTKRTFVVSLVVLQVLLVVFALLIVNSLVGLGSAQDPAPFSEVTAWVLAISAAASIIGCYISSCNCN